MCSLINVLLFHLIFTITVRGVSATIAPILEMIKRVYLPKIQRGSGAAGHKPSSTPLQNPQAKPLHKLPLRLNALI